MYASLFIQLLTGFHDVAIARQSGKQLPFWQVQQLPKQVVYQAWGIGNQRHVRRFFRSAKGLQMVPSDNEL